MKTDNNTQLFDLKKSQDLASKSDDDMQCNITRKYSILLDISVFIAGNLNHRARTGVYTVTAKILEFLLLLHKQDRIFLSVCIPHSAPLFLASLKFYLEELQPIGVRLYFIETLPRINIYHSPFHVFPKEKINVDVRFLTLHDLIPIKLPDFFSKEDGIVHEFVKKLDAVTNEDWVLCVSKNTLLDFYNYAPQHPKNRTQITLEAGDPTRFYPCTDAAHLSGVHQKYQIPSAPYLLSVCTLEPRKNLKFVIQGFIHLLQENKTPDLHLVLVGAKGWLYDEIFAEYEKHPEYKGRIIFTGYVPDEDLAPLYSGALAFVYMSLYEGFGLPPLEAMQCGTPVITSNTSSLPEVVGDGGLMLDPTDLEAFCAAVYEMYSNPVHRAEMAEKALARAKLFSWERFAQQTIDAYALAMREHYADDEIPPPPEDRNARARRLKVVIDGVFFQYFKTGIARLFQTLLEEWVSQGYGKYLLVLDRDDTSPKIEGIIYRTIAAHNEKNPEQDSYLLQQICLEEGADVFISSYYTTPITIPSIMIVYDMIPEILSGKLCTELSQKYHAITYASHLIAISHNTAKDLVKFFPTIHQDKISISHLAVADIFYPATEKEIADFRNKYHITLPYFFLPGLRTGYKNAILLFQAFLKMPNYEKYALVFTRGSKLESEFKPYLDKINFHLIEYLEDAELRAAYSGALALVYPSKYEGFGLPILEAMACSCPVIAATAPSSHEIAENAALFIEPDNVLQLRDALIQVQKPEIRQDLSEKGFIRKTAFSWQKTANTIWEYLNKVAQEHIPVFLPIWIENADINDYIADNKLDESCELAFTHYLAQPEKAIVVSDLAATSMIKKSWQNGFEQIKNAFILMPTNVSIQINLACAYIGLRQYDEAMQIICAILQAQPERADLQDIALWLATKLEYHEYRQTIIEAIYKSRKNYVKDTFNGVFNLTLSLTHPGVAQWLQNNHKQQAINFLKQIIMLKNAYGFNPYNDLGIILLTHDTSTQKEGLAYLKQAVTLYPSDTEASKNLLSAYFLLSDYKNALIQCKNLLNHFPDNSEILAAMGFAYAKLENYREARSIFEKVLQLNPDNYTVKQWKHQISRLLQQNYFK